MVGFLMVILTERFTPGSMVGFHVYHDRFRLGIIDIWSVADGLDENNWIGWYCIIQFNWKQIVWFVIDGLVGIQ